MRGRAIAALGAAATLAVGCGGNNDGQPVVGATITVWADSALGGVVRDARIGDTRLDVKLDSTSRLLAKLADGAQRPDVLLVQADTFPSWDESADGLRDSRIVAHDPLVLVTRKPGAAPVTLGSAGGDPLAFPRTGAAGEAARHAIAALPRRQTPEKQMELPLASDVLQALRDKSADVGLVPRSALRNARDADRFNATELTDLGIDVQTAYSSERPDGRQVVVWLDSREARRRFAEAGFGPPGPNARPVDCSANESEPCTERAR